MTTNFGIACQFSTGNPPYLLASDGATWKDISTSVIKFSITRGKTRLIDRFETGTLNLTLKNLDRRFDPTNTSGPYYPNLLPMRPIRLGFVLNGVTYWLFTGYVERWPQIWKGPSWAEVDLVAVDGFEFLNTHAITSAYASGQLFAAAGPIFFLFTSTVLGYVGNSTVVNMVRSGNNTALSVTVSGLTVTINVATDGSGTCTSTFGDITAAVAANVSASALITVTYFATLGTVLPGYQVTALTAGSNIVALAGGTFVQEFTGARNNDVLDNISFPTGSSYRNISTGAVQVQAETFPVNGSTSALDHLYGVEQTEDGALFLDRNGRVTFIGRADLTSIASLTPTAVFTDAKSANVGTYPYQEGTEGHWDIDLINNNIISNRLNASAGDIQTASDATSIAEYFTRTLSISPLSITDDDSLQLAQALLFRNRQPPFYFDQITCFPGNPQASLAALTYWQQLVQLELMQTIQTLRHPPGTGPEITVTGPLISLEVSGDRSIQNTTWRLLSVPGFPLPFFFLDSPVYGLLDNPNVGLGY